MISKKSLSTSKSARGAKLAKAAFKAQQRDKQKVDKNGAKVAAVLPGQKGHVDGSAMLRITCTRGHTSVVSQNDWQSNPLNCVTRGTKFNPNKRTKGGHLCPVVGCRGNVEVEEVAAEAAAADDDEEPQYSAKDGGRCPQCRKKVSYGTKYKEKCNGLCTVGSNRSTPPHGGQGGGAGGSGSGGGEGAAPAENAPVEKSAAKSKAAAAKAKAKKEAAELAEEERLKLICHGTRDDGERCTKVGREREERVCACVRVYMCVTVTG